MNALTPASLTEFRFPAAATCWVSARASIQCFMTSSGTFVASFVASRIAAARSAFCGSVSFGRPNASITLLKASVSSSISAVNRARISSAWTRIFFISSSTAAYFFLPIVRLQTIAVSAEPRAPASAATLPPPGAGEEEARSSRNPASVLLAAMAVSAFC